MDEFVRSKLTEWGLSQWIEKFEDEGIDKESLYCLRDQEISELIPKVGPRAKFKEKLMSLKQEQEEPADSAQLLLLDMDEFVRSKLTEWGLSQWIEKFEDEGIDKESLYCLRDQEISELIPKVGPRAKFKEKLMSLKQEQEEPADSAQLLLLDMDEFVRCKLTEWGLSQWIETFQERCIDEKTLYCLPADEIKELIPLMGPRAKFKEKLRLLKQVQKEAEDPAESQVFPSTSGTRAPGKRKPDFQDESSNSPLLYFKQRRLNPEKTILSDVKEIMEKVSQRLPKENTTKLNEFLKIKIRELETDKRELVGVFGKTGAGKSSLINTIIGEKKLLPSGSVGACTSVMIKVEANVHSSKYEAEIEFMTREEWSDELWSMIQYIGDNTDQERHKDDDYHDFAEKLSALYGEEWENKSTENLMDKKYFREIPEFLISKTKTLTCETAEELSAKFVKYTRGNSIKGAGKNIKRWYWPLVKCVTVRVPRNDLLQHVTLVDLPGNGDRNKSRDRMWKELIGSCSTVWIVTEMNRAASDKENWDILESASSLMGNGGECQHIHFICTKTDVIDDLDDWSAAEVRARILDRNKQVKEEMIKEFNKLKKVKKQFSDGCFKVFTVSSYEFLIKRRLEPDDTEIPKLQDFLQNLNDCHSETLNYVSGAHEILSLMQGTKSQLVVKFVADKKAAVCRQLEGKIRNELDEVRKSMEVANMTFEKCLTEGVEKSKRSCEENLRSIIYPRGTPGSIVHRMLKCLVEKSGIYETRKGKPINLNAELSSHLTDSIDEEFRKTFPNEGKSGPYHGVINKFSLGTEELIQQNKDVELQLTFLKTEEEKLKTKLNRTIRQRKKMIYNSLTDTIEEYMKECYKKAAAFRGKGTLGNMRETLEKHVHDEKNRMFERAKAVMLFHLNKLKEEILQRLEMTLMESIEQSLKSDDSSIPDVSRELEMVKSCYHKLKGSEDHEISVTGLAE
ncbi:nuclear GTPase SLIP-GC-like isoform X1 [Mastacembelus armatus]|uniref:nuclear GTPase SLIP-GC-like isoform X1 n=1 Tax=Mastacembelus armatus TaxID=205130 RepID=UPI000E46441B|nr:nuclear GTPase SLIP-GC-like isoform X1 [Mastacembelus armatus]